MARRPKSDVARQGDSPPARGHICEARTGAQQECSVLAGSRTGLERTQAKRDGGVHHERDGLVGACLTLGRVDRDVDKCLVLLLRACTTVTADTTAEAEDKSSAAWTCTEPWRRTTHALSTYPTVLARPHRHAPQAEEPGSAQAQIVIGGLTLATYFATQSACSAKIAPIEGGKKRVSA